MRTPNPRDQADQVGTETIVAIATPPGRGGIGIVRLSGAGVPAIAVAILGTLPDPRMAHHAEFKDRYNKTIDSGVAIFFPAPNSYTGEDVLELQGHGSPVIMQVLVRRCLDLDARLAKPGEFSERAFLNNKIDLIQAESIADLIASSTESAARSAVKSLQGDFSNRVHELTESVTQLRIFVEAAIDFPDEEIDFLEDHNIVAQIEKLAVQFKRLNTSVQQGKIIRDGLKMVLTGLPNAGKSSLLNALSKEQRAIVSEIPGTTRDVLNQFIEIDGLPVEIIDTAGIRDTSDKVEAEGVRRAKLAQSQADLVVLVVDDADSNEQQITSLLASETTDAPLVLVRNKIDLSGRKPKRSDQTVSVSALTGLGLELLREQIKVVAGFRQSEDSQFLARERHIDALTRAEGYLKKGLKQQAEFNAAELLADDLVACQRALAEITGEVSSDALLGMIFGAFCIGK